MRLIERVYSDHEWQPDILLANIHTAVDVRQNLHKIEGIIELAHRKGVNMLILPELAVTGYLWGASDPQEIRELLDEGEQGHIAPWIKNVVDSLDDSGKGLQYVILGNARRKGEALLNSVFVLSPEAAKGTVPAYDKVFLTPIERRYFQQGTDQRLTVDTAWGKFGFLICYDLCFVELARQYAMHDDVDAIVTVASWASEAIREYSHMNVKTDHYYGFLWNLMNASKAAYNEVWSLGVNTVGAHDVSGTYYWGGSGVWAPSGMLLVQASNIKEELILVRNLDIHGQREREQDTFNYRIDFHEFYRPMRERTQRPEPLQSDCRQPPGGAP